jgi:hypothetical protein
VGVAIVRTIQSGKELLVVFAVLAIAGCSTGFDRGALRERLASEPLQVTEQDIKAALELKPQLRFPFKLAVYLQEESRGSDYNRSSSQWRWSEADKSEIVSWEKPLRREGIVSDLFLISDLTTSGTDLKSVRLAAAQHGADAVLIIRGVSQIDRYPNPMSFLYLTIIGCWIVPGTHVDSLMMVQGGLWDVANGYLYATADSEGEATKTGPAMLLEDKDVLAKSRTTALEDFGDEFVARLRSLSGT